MEIDGDGVFLFFIFFIFFLTKKQLYKVTLVLKQNWNKCRNTAEHTSAEN
jgi:hypothetical protein